MQVQIILFALLKNHENINNYEEHSISSKAMRLRTQPDEKVKTKE